MESTTTDIWSFKTQGKNYDKYRTQYPPELIQRMASISKGKKAYLDIATGTGILLFQLWRNFSDICVGNDISEPQLQISREKLKLLTSQEEFTKPRIELIHSDLLQLTDELKQRELSTKFDLITIGAALHWFDHHKLFEYLNTQLLAPSGKICILSPVLNQCEYNVPDPEFQKKAQAHCDVFHGIIKPYFRAKRESVDSGYSDYDFSEYYKNVHRETAVEYQPMTLEDFITYYKTLSSYNLCLAENANKSGFQDPIEDLRREFQKDLDNYAKISGNEIGEFPILRVTPCFYIECSH